MNDTKLLPDDPRLTAYALGELNLAECAVVEAALRADPALRVVVEEIRATARQIEAALAGEVVAPATAGTEATTVVVEINGRADTAPISGANAARTAKASSEGSPRTGGTARKRRSRGKLVRFPQSYFVIAGLAAACFALMVVLYRERFEAKQQARIAQQQKQPRPAPPAAAERPGLVAVSLAPVHGTDVASSAVTSVESPPPPATPATPADTGRSLAFIDTGLTLLEQARRDPAPLAGPAGSGAETAAAPEPVVVARGESIAASGITGVSDLAARTAAADAATSMASTPSAGSAQNSSASPTVARTAAPATFAGAVNDDIVRLDTFTVTADPLQSFLPMSYLTSTANATRGRPEPQPLPRVPRGARFGRTALASAEVIDNAFVRVADQQISTFAIDVDTASYANIRRTIEQGVLPPREAVRIEELLNYFPYDYRPPAVARGEPPPFAAALEVAEAPWAPGRRLVRIGLKGRDVSNAERAVANLVLLIDVSESMKQANKLPLVKESMRLLVEALRPDDRVAIVAYAKTSGLVLPSTPVARSREILAALEGLEAGGSTNGGLGLHLAYDTARAHFIPGGNNRVILCTDGDFNGGQAADGDLAGVVEEKAGSGVFLTVLGFGLANHQDAVLERLASKARGNYGYIDTRREAEKLLVEQLCGTLVPIARDVRVQVTFNPARVLQYRLIGYENRPLRREDFANDQVDAGDLGAGHTVTALYEIIPTSAADAAGGPRPEDVKYQAKGAISTRMEMPVEATPAPREELLTVQVRYKKPDGLITRRQDFGLVDKGTTFANASADFQFAAAVAEFGMILRDSPHRGSGTLGDVLAWAASAVRNRASDPRGYRGEFIDLVRKTQRLLR